MSHTQGVMGRRGPGKPLSVASSLSSVLLEEGRGPYLTRPSVSRMEEGKMKEEMEEEERASRGWREGKGSCWLYPPQSPTSKLPWNWSFRRTGSEA